MAQSFNKNAKTERPCSREEVVPVLVEGDGHDPVREVERLLDPVAMMDIDVYVDCRRAFVQQTFFPS